MAVTPIEHRKATWEEYQALGEDVRCEYIDGEIVMTPPPRISHQMASRRLANLLEAVLSEGYLVIQGARWKPGRDEFVPDVMVVAVEDLSDDRRFEQVPLLCVEVLSTNRANDYVTKMAKYAQAGLDYYWILDPDGVLDVMIRDESGHYRLAQQVSREEPAEVAFGPFRVTVDLTQILR